MSKRSVVPEIAISNVRATQSTSCLQINVTWLSPGSASYEVDRRPSNAVAGIVRVPRTQSANTSYLDTVPDTQSYVYTVTVWDARGNRVTGVSNSASAKACIRLSSGLLIQSEVDTFESQKGSFELLFTQGDCIKHYTHKKGSILAGHWKHVNTLYPPEGCSILNNAISLTQSISGDFVAVAVVTPPQDEGQSYLVSYVFDPESGWQGPSILTVDDQSITGATGAPALIQTRQGAFELFIPLGNTIGHYIHERGSILNDPWMALASFGAEDTLTYTAISLVLTASEQLELITRAVPVQTPQQRVSTDYLVAFVANSVNPQTPVQHVGPLTEDGQLIDGITGSPTFIQNDRGIFELVVPHGALMDQYIQETDSIEANLWKHVSTLEPLKNDPGIQFTATSIIQSTSRKLDLVARVTHPHGEGKDSLVSFEFTGWKGPRPIVVDDTSANGDNEGNLTDKA